MRWAWLREDILYTVHDAQLAEHGGLAGVRDVGLFVSALARPHNAAAYGNPDYAALAASYGYAIARNYPFIDGTNERHLLRSNCFLVSTASSYSRTMWLAS